jgi:medium-chain acyl-[acyl-carrier-protein] hydrolase
MNTVDAWISLPKADASANVRLFCFPYAGAGPSAFRLWPDAFPANVSVCSVHLPGREYRLREPLFVRMESLIEALVPVIGHFSDKPFALYGHSLGGLVAYELARALRRQGLQQPECLLVSGRRAPQSTPRPSIYQLPEAAFLQVVRRFDGIPEMVWRDRELMDMVLPVLRADFTILDTYRYAEGEPLGIPIVAAGGNEDMEASLAEMEGWGAQTTADFQLRTFPGKHFFINTERTAFLQMLSSDLMALLNRVQVKSAASTR